MYILNFQKVEHWQQTQNDLIIIVSLKYYICVQRLSATKNIPCHGKEKVIEMNILLLILLKWVLLYSELRRPAIWLIYVTFGWNILPTPEPQSPNVKMETPYFPKYWYISTKLLIIWRHIPEDSNLVVVAAITQISHYENNYIKEEL
jgi:hypothetical protein